MTEQDHPSSGRSRLGSPDKLALHVKGLGEAKAAADEAAEAMISAFKRMVEHRDRMGDEGVLIDRIQFADPVRQAAWERFQRGDKSVEIPLMPKEDQLVPDAKGSH